MPRPPSLVVRADGGPGLGVGHLARGLALAQAWNDRRGTTTLVSRQPPPLWVERYRLEGASAVEPGATPDDADWWVIDGYALSATPHHPTATRVLRVDDHDGAGTGGAGATLVLDQNVGADRARYPAAAAALIGPRYALLRRELAAARQPPATRDRARRLVVILGGAPSDAVRAIGQAVAADERLAHLDVEVLDGSADVAVALQGADLALAAAGTVSYELCCLGVPAVLIAVADNQEPLAAHLAEAGAAMRTSVDAEAIARALASLALDREQRDAMARAGQGLVDGIGARRVVTRLRAELLQLREVTLADAHLLHEWNNDPATRAASFSSAPIPWDDHLGWLNRRLDDASARSYIAADRLGLDVGLVRFDERDAAVEIGVTVAPVRRGEGWGASLVDVGCRRWARDGVRRPGGSLVEARIKVGNDASVRAFLDADFDPRPSKDPAVLRYARHLDGDDQHT